MEYKNHTISPKFVRQQNDKWYYDVNIHTLTGPDMLIKKLHGKCDCRSEQEAIEHAKNFGVAWIDENL